MESILKSFEDVPIGIIVFVVIASIIYFLFFFDIAEKIILLLVKYLLKKAALVFLSAFLLWNPYIFSCLTKDENLEWRK